MLIEFVIPGPPQGKARARTRVVKANDGRVFASHYTTKETTSYENLVKGEFRRVHAGPPTDAPCAITITGYFPTPASWSKKKREAAINENVPVQVKPDWDNIGKIVSDALNEIAYRDDKQIYSAIVRKVYSETPRTQVRLNILDTTNEQ